MRRDCDTASSVVIGFVVLLMLIALAIGIWALISLPGELKEAESSHAIALSNAFLDMKLSMDKVRVSEKVNLSGARFSMLMPGSSGMAGTTIGFEKEVGVLRMEWSGGNSGFPLSPPLGDNGKSVDRIFAQVGGTRGTTSIGYEGGGVFRSDNGNAVWLTPGLLEVYPDELDNATTRVDLVVVNLTGDAAVSSNWGVPLDCVFVERKDTQVGPENRTLTISFSGKDADQIRLWYALFYEAKIRYGKYNNSLENMVTAEINSDWTTLKITGSDEMRVKVSIREATYDVSLVNRYES
ncbi:hypothetical protein O0S10_07020 [Methanocorpusculum sp. MG]|uniref:Type IV pilin n=1 Tax=Methanocorpusculum petauri TaxID=3002863 RepID=A0ABT4IGV3_9EURY|nr:hypothetical protein [Methanocorpusculum petauri]MCZ0860975.1 hypothetical protein [Methanocorpusculum petauri]